MPNTVTDLDPAAPSDSPVNEAPTQPSPLPGRIALGPLDPSSCWCHGILRVYPPQNDSVGNPLDCENEGCLARRDGAAVSAAHHGLERIPDQGLEFCIDLFHRPEERLEVLNPFQIAHRDSSCVAQDVRYEKDPFGLQYLVCVRRSGAVGSFSDDFALYAIRIECRDLIFFGSTDEHVTVQSEQLLVMESASANPFRLP